MFVRLFLIASLFLSGFATPLAAKWRVAESDRFVIYSDSRAEDLARFAETLEQFHVAMELESGRKVAVPSPSSRLTVYMVGSREDLRDLYSSDRRSAVGGFYIPRANGSVTFIPNVQFRTRSSGTGRVGTRYGRSGGTSQLDSALSTLLHEYAHHFLIGSARHAMPRWLSEGAAEYFSSARFNDDGSVDIGLPNNSRAWEISQAAPVSVRQLLDYELYRKNRSNRYSAYYGRAWLLFHYLRFNSERAGELQRYWSAVASGMDSMEAGEKFFGDLDKLESELKDYGRQRSMAGMRFAASDIRTGRITVSELSDGHADMMDVIIRSKRGVDQEEAQKVVVDARSIAGRHPDNAHVLAALAEAEYDAGENDAAIIAAKRAIAINPKITNAYVQQGYALFKKAKDADNKKAAYASALAPFTALNGIENDHTQPLIYYYRSFTERGLAPPESAKFALERATQLAPFDKALAMEAASMKAAEGETTVARYLLAPVAADPHGGRMGSLAQAMVELLKVTPDGSRVDLKALRDGFEAADGEENDGGDEGDEEA